jgi:Zn ribbon nucleic-acid-binding protein
MDEADQVECPQCGHHHPKRRLSRISLKVQATGNSAALPVSSGGL